MSRKYIGQQSDYNFVYPNNDPKQYDVEIVHDINNNSVSGTVTNFTGTSISTTGMTISFNWSWTKNGAEPFISESGNINLLSVHMMSGDQNYFKPWRLVEYENNATTGSTSYTGTTSFTVLPSPAFDEPKSSWVKISSKEDIRNFSLKYRLIKPGPAISVFATLSLFKLFTIFSATFLGFSSACFAISKAILLA